MIAPGFLSQSKEYRKAYLQRPEVKAREAAHRKAYYVIHKDQWREYRRERFCHKREEIKEYRKAYRQRPEVKAREKEKRQRPEAKARMAAWSKLHNQDPKVKERTRKNMLIREYGLTMVEYQELLSRQNGQCAICRTSDWGGSHGTSCIDHDHKTGVVRGILCHSCNVTLGLIKDNKEVAMNIVAYIEKHEAL